MIFKSYENFKPVIFDLLEIVYHQQVMLLVLCLAHNVLE